MLVAVMHSMVIYRPGASVIIARLEAAEAPD